MPNKSLTMKYVGTRGGKEYIKISDQLENFVDVVGEMIGEHPGTEPTHIFQTNSIQPVKSYGTVR